VRERRIVRQSTVAEMTSNQIGALRLGVHPAIPGAVAQPFPFRGDLDAFGFGFQIHMPSGDADKGLRSVGSCGWMGILNTYFWIDPREQIGVAVLMQFLPAADAGAVEVLRGIERLVYT
jgi:CubicO group peptidase (beta-lactamase class C family)